MSATEQGIGPLDLGDADTKGFEAFDAGRYPAVIHKIENDAVKNTQGTGSLPSGTLMVKVQHRITQEIDGSTKRIVFSNYFPVLPKDYDKGKGQKMKGMFVNFLIALGEKEEDIRKKGYTPDYDALTGVAHVVTVGKEPKRDRDGHEIPGEFNNPVKGVKHIDTWTGETPEGAGGLL